MVPATIKPAQIFLHRCTLPIILSEDFLLASKGWVPVECVFSRPSAKKRIGEDVLADAAQGIHVADDVFVIIA